MSFLNRGASQTGVLVLASLVLSALFFSTPVRAQNGTCAANEAGQTIDFTSSPWIAGSAIYSATPGTGASQVTVNGSVAGGFRVPLSPATGASGGYGATMVYTVNRTTASQTNSASFTFAKPVDNLRLTITDIDYFRNNGGAYNDQVTIIGTGLDGSTVTPSAVAGSSLVEIFGAGSNNARASATAFSTNNCDLNTNSCNATFNFSAPVTSITITYANTTGNNWASGDPPSQLVGIYFNGFCVQNPDLTVSKAAPSSSKVMTPFAFQLSANNPGSTASTGAVTVSDTINASLFNIQSITPASGWSCTPASGFPITSGTVTVSCASSASLAAGASARPVATINVSAVAGALPGPANNTATISGGNEANTSNNTATTSTALSPLQANLSIDKTSSGTFISGATVNYTVTVTNAGPDSVNGAVIRDVPVSNLNCAAAAPVSCSGAACPTPPLQFSNLSSGLSLGMLSASSGSNMVTLSFSCTVL